MTEPVISIKNISKTYPSYSNNLQLLLELIGISPKILGHVNNFEALHDISFDVLKGERIGLIGQNGAGKSTLLKVISQKLSPTSGHIQRNYTKCHALLELGTGFNPEFTGEENVNQFLRLHNIQGNEYKTLSQIIAAFSELKDFYYKPIKTYSSGMQARLAFAAATHIESDLLVLDETLAVGDAYYVGKCLNYLRNELPSSTTVLFVSHDLALTQQLCDRVIWLNNGRVADDGNTLDVSRKYLSYILNYNTGEQPISDINDPPKLTTADISTTAQGPQEPQEDINNLTVHSSTRHELTSVSSSQDDSTLTSPTKINSFFLQNNYSARTLTAVYHEDISFCLSVSCSREYLDVFPVVAIYLPSGQCATQFIAEKTTLIKGDQVIKFDCTPLFLGQGSYIASAALFETINSYSEDEQIAYVMHDRKYKFSVIANPLMRPNTAIYNQPFKVARINDAN